MLSRKIIPQLLSTNLVSRHTFQDWGYVFLYIVSRESQSKLLFATIAFWIFRLRSNISCSITMLNTPFLTGDSAAATFFWIPQLEVTNNPWVGVTFSLTIPKRFFSPSHNKTQQWPEETPPTQVVQHRTLATWFICVFFVGGWINSHI